jgi:hypothetical protein
MPNSISRIVPTSEAGPQSVAVLAACAGTAAAPSSHATHAAAAPSAAAWVMLAYYRGLPSSAEPRMSGRSNGRGGSP